MERFLDIFSDKMLLITGKFSFKKLTLIMIILSVLSGNFFNAVIVGIYYSFITKKMNDPYYFDKTHLTANICLEALCALSNLIYLIHLIISLITFCEYYEYLGFDYHGTWYTIKMMLIFARISILPLTIFSIIISASFLQFYRRSLYRCTIRNTCSNKITILLVISVAVGILTAAVYILSSIFNAIELLSEGFFNSFFHTILTFLFNCINLVWLIAYAMYLNQIKVVMNYLRTVSSATEVQYE